MKELIKRQQYRKINEATSFKKIVAGVPSWIRYIRKTLGMSSEQLAERMGLAPSSLYQLERKEVTNKVNLQSLQKAADAMGCDLIYAFVPRIPIESFVEQQALMKAKELVKESIVQMEYEDQAVSKKEIQMQIKDLAEKLKNSKRLWEKSE